MTDLTIDNAFDGEYYSKFVNLKRFHINVSKGRNFKIEHVPKSVTSLKITVNSTNKFNDFDARNGHVKIKARQDWPPQLKSLSLDDSRNKTRAFTDLLNKLPLNLQSLSICGHSQCQALSQVSESMCELSLKSTFQILNASHVDLNLEFHSKLTTLSLDNLKMISSTKSCKLPNGLKIFHLFSCDFSLSLNNFKFDNCKSTLKRLRISRYKEPFEFINLNFSVFSNLTDICFNSCGIKSLTHFKPPYCLKKLEIYHNPISTIDESCDLFNNENSYPMLQEVLIENCKISKISPNVEWPINLQHLTIKDEKVKEFYFNASIAKHQSLRILTLSKLSAIKFCDCVNVNSKSNFSQLDLTVTQDFLPTSPYDLLKFYDKVHLFLRKRVIDRKQIIYKCGTLRLFLGDLK
ncbi:hypothetical protein DFJ63DRAFT_337367 [Scheffersomyces coipomensis]|uniref:uncharacterized protein n=1 Tax=Scheffersomyces coipomensis TaxID=1788519 RepID=UPI00315D90F7